MGDIFNSDDAQRLLKDKFVVILGSSSFRSIYKDILSLLQTTKFMSTTHSKIKGEFKFKGDTLIEGGRKGVMHNGNNYREKRQYKTDKCHVHFEFITRAYNKHVEDILKSLRDSERKPDVLLLNSTLWDLTHYGASCTKEYQENLQKLFDQISTSLLPSAPNLLVIWAAAPPISSKLNSSLLVPEEEFLKDSLRMEIICANAFAAQLAEEHGFDFLDLHFYLRHQIHRRVSDGIHWDNTALRRIVNLFLTHIAEAWGVTLPGRVSNDGIPKDAGDLERWEKEKEKKKLQEKEMEMVKAKDKETEMEEGKEMEKEKEKETKVTEEQKEERNDEEKKNEEEGVVKEKDKDGKNCSQSSSRTFTRLRAKSLKIESANSAEALAPPGHLPGSKDSKPLNPGQLKPRNEKQLGFKNKHAPKSAMSSTLGRNCMKLTS